MQRRIGIWLLGLLPLQALAWEEQQTLDYIMAHNPVLQSYREVGDKYRPSSEALDRVLEYTSLYGKVGVGGTDYLADSMTTQVGVQIAIPLTSTREKREFALKAQEETKAIDQLQAKVLADIAKLREHEADLAATERRIAFYSDKSDWLKQRTEEGLAEVSELWDIGQKLNEERAAADKLFILVDAQRYQLSRYAGNRWQTLLDYLSSEEPVTLAQSS